MKKIKLPKLNKNSVYIFLICAVLFAALQTFMILRYYEPDVYLYAYGTALPTVFYILLSVFVIGVLVCCSFADCREYSDKPSDISLTSRILAPLCVVSLIAASIYQYLPYSTRAAQLAYAVQKQDNFIKWTFILGFAAVLYFIAVFIFPTRYKKIKVLLGCVTIIWHIMYLLSVYFDMTSPLNDPIRLMNEFAIVGMMMYLTVEIRFLCGIPKKGFYIGTSVVAFALLLSSSASNILYAAINGTFNSDISIFVYQLLSAGYVITRLFSQLNTKQ